MSPQHLAPPITEHDHVRGAADAPVTLIEYGDFQCPYCGAAYPVLKKVTERLGDRLRFVFRHFPIADSHPNAEHAAESAESVAAQLGELTLTINAKAGEQDQLFGSVTTMDIAAVPERKTVKNRLHLDLRADGTTTREELQRLLDLGARRTDVGQASDASWVVLSDPEGNEFCLLSRSVQEVLSDPVP